MPAAAVRAASNSPSTCRSRQQQPATGEIEGADAFAIALQPVVKDARPRQSTRDFRFAVIDEAFGRGSDGSTRYALELFAKLGLQLLIVTPLQKVHVIEPYVKAIGFVDNPTSTYSRLQTMTIEEYRTRRDGPRS